MLPNPTSKKQPSLIIIFGGGFIALCVALAIFGPSPDSGSDTPSQLSQQQLAEDQFKKDSSAAWAAALSFVERRLKAPSTAKFPYSSLSERCEIKPFGNRHYFVAGWVDSQNSFGAMIRTHWRCEVHPDGDSWVLDWIEMN